MAKIGYDTGSLAPRPMAAAVACFFGGLTGSAAAGIAEFFGRRAFFTVAGGARAVRVRFAAGTGVFGSTVLVIEYIVLVIAGCAGDWFRHGISCNFYVV
jgi:hypothetical protein